MRSSHCCWALMLLVLSASLTDCGSAHETKHGNPQPTTLTVPLEVACDVLVVGGSTAALSAALTAANHSSEQTVCLTEPTDWPGGQLTSSGVTAIDYGYDLVRQPRNLPASFRAMMASLPSHNPGQCTVGCTGSCLHQKAANTTAEALVATNASQCYLPLSLLNNWIFPTLGEFPNLKVFLMTVPTSVEYTGSRLSMVHGVQRRAKHPAAAWTTRLSQQLPDWYSPKDSALFQKQPVAFVLSPHGFVIEASELGGVLVLSRAQWRQGVEVPTEQSNATDATCGTAFTYPLFLKLYERAVPDPPLPLPPSPPRPYGIDGFRKPYCDPGTGGANPSLRWHGMWTWRRAHGTGNASEPINLAKPGEISQHNWNGNYSHFRTEEGNDYPRGYLLLPLGQNGSGHGPTAQPWRAEVEQVRGNASPLQRQRQQQQGLPQQPRQSPPTSQHQAHTTSPQTVTLTPTPTAWAGGVNLTSLDLAERQAYGFYKWLRASAPDEALGSKVGLLRNVSDGAGTNHGLTKVPYVRDTRRAVGHDGYVLTATELGKRAADRVAIVEYGFDVHRAACSYPDYILHPKARGGKLYVPLRALVSSGADNLLVAGKTIAQTFLAASTTRLHPGEWATGLAAGVAASVAVDWVA
eukprot:m.214821 g.214821  ORF g.214821 m.214821 type:complete len:635 (+) comp18625_c0_seq1:160-2064(+)